MTEGRQVDNSAPRGWYVYHGGESEGDCNEVSTAPTHDNILVIASGVAPELGRLKAGSATLRLATPYELELLRMASRVARVIEVRAELEIVHEQARQRAHAAEKNSPRP